ncbi:MAG: 30S ribosomal protein S6 [Fuerstiella sp.]
MSVAEVKTVNEHLYEGMFLVGSSQFANDPDATINAILTILQKAGATIVAHRPWQDGKLAYEISGHRKGLHYVVCFRMPSSGMDVVVRQCHLSETVIRQLIIKHTPELFNAMVDALNGVHSVPAEDEETPEAPAEAEE